MGPEPRTRKRSSGKPSPWPAPLATFESALREAGHWTPILMLTAKDGEYDEAEALDTGADDFLSKPVDDATMFVVTDDVQLVLSRLIDEVRWLVHVSPDASDAVVGVHAMQITPPATRLGQSVVDENTLTGPDSRHKQVAVAAALEEVSLEPLFENEIAIATG